MTAHLPSVRPQLLVSVQNASEARLAQRLGVPWIDLKNPAAGSLGRPDVTTAREILDTLAAGRCQTSVALGELKTLDTATASQLMQLFPIAKVGLAGLATDPSKSDASGGRCLDDQTRRDLDDLARRQHSPGQLVLAAYADHQRAAAPSPAQVIQLAAQLQVRYVLIDTFVKDGLGLFHWQTPRQIAALGAMARAIGAQLVVAGSLGSADWPLLSEAAPAIIGVRGGVCTGGRASGLCPERIADWLTWTNSQFFTAETQRARRE